MSFKKVFGWIVLAICLTGFTLTGLNEDAAESVKTNDGQIYMDANNGNCGFRWGYNLLFLDSNNNTIQHIYAGSKTCRHDEYYDIPKNADKIEVTIYIENFIINEGSDFCVYTGFVDARTCGFKVYGLLPNWRIFADFYGAKPDYKEYLYENICDFGSIFKHLRFNNNEYLCIKHEKMWTYNKNGDIIL
ncbi:MAG: hypothetical protein CfClM3_0443 [Methanobrevibacter sp. CfCl-M3]